MKKSTAVHSTLVNTYLVLPTFYMKNENHMWVNQSNWKISTIARSLFLLTCFKKIPHELPTVMQASQTNAVVNCEALLCIFPEEKNAESCFVDRCCLLIIQKSHADFEINLITCFFITIAGGASGWATGAVPLSSEQASAPTYLLPI